MHWGLCWLIVPEPTCTMWADSKFGPDTTLKQRTAEDRFSAFQAGIKLLWTDIRIASRLIWKAASGKTLSRCIFTSTISLHVHLWSAQRLANSARRTELCGD